MWVKAIVLIPRKGGYFHLDQAVIYRKFGYFNGFKMDKVKAKREGDGVGVALILGAPTQIDGDFGEFTVFLDWELHIKPLLEALDKSDEMTEEITGKRAWGGKRPYASGKLHHYM